jgi:hypothetical protein
MYLPPLFALCRLRFARERCRHSGQPIAISRTRSPELIICARREDNIGKTVCAVEDIRSSDYSRAESRHIL